MADLLALNKVSRYYDSKAGRVNVLQNISLTLGSGETVAIIGQSGAGKSTLLHIAGLLDNPSSGSLQVQGAPQKTMRDREKAHLRNKLFGFVYQHHHLLREFSALENVLMPAMIGRRASAVAEARARSLLKQVNLSHRESHLPSQLSGGERQRVAIARALMNQPRLLLADEPTGNLDPATATKVSDLLFNLVKEEGMALLLVTHNETLARQCHKVYRLEEGQLNKA
jgi:lipoprotein-releasing system ATP-binding protein